MAFVHKTLNSKRGAITALDRILEWKPTVFSGVADIGNVVDGWNSIDVTSRRLFLFSFFPFTFFSWFFFFTFHQRAFNFRAGHCHCHPSGRRRYSASTLRNFLMHVKYSEIAADPMDLLITHHILTPSSTYCPPTLESSGDVKTGWRNGLIKNKNVEWSSWKVVLHFVVHFPHLHEYVNSLISYNTRENLN